MELSQPSSLLAGPHHQLVPLSALSPSGTACVLRHPIDAFDTKEIKVAVWGVQSNCCYWVVTKEAVTNYSGMSSTPIMIIQPGQQLGFLDHPLMNAISLKFWWHVKSMLSVNSGDSG